MPLILDKIKGPLMHGKDGEKGDQGIQGVQGLPGTPGGAAGEMGPEGIQGLTGEKGDKGDKGDTGTPGVEGIKGDQGVQGIAGAQGIKGDTGIQGLQGIKGDQGIQGNQGIKGDQGTKGDQGIQGNQGIQGDQGNQGTKGDQGIQGNQGVQGIQGIQGVKGDTGGLPGESGLEGPQGIQGIAGAQGIKGDTGNQGVKGDKGDQGIQGIAGIQGIKGDTGIQGAIGTKGDQGVLGIQGIKGDKGFKGDQGIQGIQGAAGVKGDKGDQGPGINLTSADGSIKLTPVTNGFNLSIVRAELEFYADNETELLAAWVIAKASSKAARIFITNNITFTANRQFVQAYGAPAIKMECITQRYFYAGPYVIDFNNVVHTNITFRTAGAAYFRLVGGIGIFNNCGWVDDSTDTGPRKKNIVVIGPITSGTAKIILKTPTHFTQSSTSNVSALIQPFWISCEAAWSNSASERIYIELLEMAAVFEAARFARVLLTSTQSNCPYSVTGDESWFYAPEQPMPGASNIKANANILRTTTVDKLNASRLQQNDLAPFALGVNTNGDVVKTSKGSGNLRKSVCDFGVNANLLFGTAINTAIAEAKAAGFDFVSLSIPDGVFIQDVPLIFDIRINLIGQGTGNTKVLKNFNGNGMTLLMLNNEIKGFTYNSQFVGDTGCGLVVGDLTHQSDLNKIDLLTELHGSHGMHARNGNCNEIKLISNRNKGDGLRLDDDLPGMGDNSNAHKVTLNTIGNLGNGLYIWHSYENDVFVTSEGNNLNGIYLNSPHNKLHVYAEGNVLKNVEMGISAFSNTITGRNMEAGTVTMANKMNFLFDFPYGDTLSLRSYNLLKHIDHYKYALFVGNVAANSQLTRITSPMIYTAGLGSALSYTIDKVLPAGMTMQILITGTNEAGAITVVFTNQTAAIIDMGTVNLNIGVITPA